MRAIMLFLICCAVGLSSSAQERTFTARDAAELGDGSRIKRPLRRPWDDSDPEMRIVVEKYLGKSRCVRQPGERCPNWKERRADLVKEGDRLAEYLIRQYEASVAEGFFDTQTMLTMIARTESDMATQYLIGLAERPRSDKELRFSLSALKECRSDKAIVAALRMLSSQKPKLDGPTRALAVRAVHWNLVDGEAHQPEVRRKAMEMLRASANRTDEAGAERSEARRALQALRKSK